MSSDIFLDLFRDEKNIEKFILNFDIIIQNTIIFVYFHIILQVIINIC